MSWSIINQRRKLQVMARSHGNGDELQRERYKKVAWEHTTLAFVARHICLNDVSVVLIWSWFDIELQ